MVFISDTDIFGGIDSSKKQKQNKNKNKTTLVVKQRSMIILEVNIPYFLYLAPLKNGGNLISPLPLFSPPPPPIYIKRKHKVISSERKQYICSMQLKKHIILVFKITVYSVQSVFAMIFLTMMFMCKSRSAFLSSSFFKIAISFLSSTDAKYLATYQIFPFL